MTRHRAFFYFAVGIAAALATAFVVGCSGSTTSSAVSPEEAGASAEAGENADEDEDADTPGDATHKDEQPPLTATYACAVQGGFGWPCTVAVSGPDSAECTDPRFPYCFVGGQGGRCTAPCGDAGVGACPSVGADAGCVPTDCNARGYCK
jgi:hypothetical protein